MTASKNCSIWVSFKYTLRKKIFKVVYDLRLEYLQVVVSFYFFSLAFSLVTAAWAAAKRAMGTRNGEQLT